MRETPARVLVVEDHDDTREMYLFALELAGLEARAALDAAAAFDTAVDWQPDVVVTDFLLRRGNGAELCHQLHHDPRTCGIPVLVVTGSTSTEDVERILGAGCANIRVKPYLPDVLVTEVQQLATTKAPHTGSS